MNTISLPNFVVSSIVSLNNKEQKEKNESKKVMPLVIKTKHTKALKLPEILKESDKTVNSKFFYRSYYFSSVLCESVTPICIIFR